MPIIPETISIEAANSPATGATNFIACPICSMFVLDLVIVATNTSLTLERSDTSSFIALSVSVTISVALPSSRLPIKARSRTPRIDSRLSFQVKPAIDKNRRASADSTAVKTVVRPISLAFSLRASNALPVVLETACT